MPGQFAWRNGANNYLFGANDTLKWPTVNTTNSPNIQALLATLQLPIIREWFPKYRTGKSGTLNSDADYEALIGVPVACRRRLSRCPLPMAGHQLPKTRRRPPR